MYVKRRPVTSFPCLVRRVVKPPSLDPGFRMSEANLLLLPDDYLTRDVSL